MEELLAEHCKHVSRLLLYLFVFLLSFSLFAADGIKLRASKSETNGTVKPPETNPVSNTTAQVQFNVIYLIFDSYTGEYLFRFRKCSCHIFQQMAVFTLFVLFLYLSRMKTWSGWRTTFLVLLLMCKHHIKCIFINLGSCFSYQACVILTVSFWFCLSL